MSNGADPLESTKYHKPRGPVGWTSPLKKTQNKEKDQEENDQREMRRRGQDWRNRLTRYLRVLSSLAPTILSGREFQRLHAYGTKQCENRCSTANHRERSTIHCFRAACQSGQRHPVQLRKHGTQRMSVIEKYFEKVRQRANQSSKSQIDAQRWKQVPICHTNCKIILIRHLHFYLVVIE